MKNGNSVYLIKSKAELIKKMGVNPIYLYEGKYYVGLETLYNNELDEEMENCVEFSSMEFAEEFIKETFPAVV